MFLNNKYASCTHLSFLFAPHRFVTINSLAIPGFYLLLDQFGESIRPAIPDLNEDEVIDVPFYAYPCNIFQLCLSRQLIFNWCLQIHELFNLFDTDCDGRISKDGFFTCLRRNPLLIALFSPCLLNKDFSEDDNRLVEEIV